MKKLNKTTLLLVMAAALAFTLSCSKKSNPKPANANVTGYWFGYFMSGGSKINQSILFYSNGKIKVYDFYENPTSTDTTQALDGYGTYSVSGNKVSTKDSFANGEAFSDNGTVSTGNPQTITFSEGDVYTRQSGVQNPD